MSVINLMSFPVGFFFFSEGPNQQYNSKLIILFLFFLPELSSGRGGAMAMKMTVIFHRPNVVPGILSFRTLGTLR